MATTFEVLQRRERLLVGKRFLMLRPKIAALGVLGNAAILSASHAPQNQKLSLFVALAATVLAFFAEASWLARHELSERWLTASLSLTLSSLAVGCLLSGGLQSPIVPLLFAPVVVGFAAFARTWRSALLLAIAMFALLMATFAPFDRFPVLPGREASRMLFVSALVSLLLLAVGVVGLVDAHARISEEVERRRRDLLAEAEQRAASVEHLGAHVAHEVKNPLTAVRGLVQLLERKALDENDRKRFSVVIQEVDRALEVLNGYLTFARPIRDPKLAEIELRTLLDDVARVLEARAHEKRLTVAVRGHGIAILGDRQQLRDAILNLALNAISALAEGGKLELEVLETEDSVKLRVIDNGQGMSNEVLARLGEPFVSEAEGGTGLGVLLARGVARQHGGELSFESALGSGTRATLELPKRARSRAM